jgi:nitrous oxidase accessory protein NosD
VTWEGTVTLTGATVVKKGAVLTIRPGTTVRFVRTDADGDGIGDGELVVEGRIIADGTKEAPIRFTSAEASPAPKDWTFVIIETSRGSRLSRCIFEYAFTGVQIHYSSDVAIRDCLFVNNLEGLRFSTTEATIEGNDFTGNDTGVRYESHGSRATVARNRFRDNGTAFWVVQRSTSTVTITGNDVEGSRRYAVNVGYNQRADLDYSGNWWGTADPAAIREAIFDREDDPVLGRILFEPHLLAPLKISGRR